MIVYKNMSNGPLLTVIAEFSINNINQDSIKLLAFIFTFREHTTELLGVVSDQKLLTCPNCS